MLEDSDGVWVSVEVAVAAGGGAGKDGVLRSPARIGLALIRG